MTELTNEAKQQGLLDFYHNSGLQSQPEPTAETRTTVVYDDAFYELLVRHYQNLGGSALKIMIFRQEDRPKFVGAIGHHTGSEPYAITPNNTLAEADFYQMLEQAVA